MGTGGTVITLATALERLGLDRRADAAGVRKAYRSLSLEHHPDRVLDPADKAAAQRRFMKIRDAYEFLRRHPHLLGGFRVEKPGAAKTEAAPDPVDARIDEVLRRYRELHAVRPSPAAEFLNRSLDEPGVIFCLWTLYLIFIAALLARPPG